MKNTVQNNLLEEDPLGLDLNFGANVTSENLFTSLPLIEELNELGIGALCTLR